MDRTELKTRFRYHAPSPEKAVVHDKLRNAFETLAYLVVETAPDCRETSLAITTLEESLFWANAAIARRT